MKQLFYVYILECSDGTFYTGQTDNLKIRIKEHNGESILKGAVYTSTRRPVKLGHFETYETRSEAMKREHQLKQLNHIHKKVLCDNGNKIGYQ